MRTRPGLHEAENEAETEAETEAKTYEAEATKCGLEDLTSLVKCRINVVGLWRVQSDLLVCTLYTGAVFQ